MELFPRSLLVRTGILVLTILAGLGNPAWPQGGATGAIQGYNHREKADQVRVDRRLSEARPDEYQALFAEHGFSVVSYHPENAACNGHTIWLARYCA